MLKIKAAVSLPLTVVPLRSFPIRYSRVFNKAQDRPQALLAPVLCVVSLARPLLIAVNSLYRGIDVDPDLIKLNATKLPDPLAKNAHDLQQRFALVYPKAVDIPPERAGRRKPADPEKTAQHRIQSNIGKVPYPQGQGPDRRPVADAIYSVRESRQAPPLWI